MKLYKSTAVRYNELCLPIYHIYPACATFPAEVEPVEVDPSTLLKTEICQVCRRMHEKFKGEIVPTLGKPKPAKPRNGLKCSPYMDEITRKLAHMKYDQMQRRLRAWLLLRGSV